MIPAGRLLGVEKGLWRLSVSSCSSVTCLSLYVLSCVLCCTVFHFISASLPKPVNVSSSSATERHLNVGSWLRALIEEALEEQQTTNGPEAEKGKAGGCTQPDISDGQHGQRGTPLDSLGLRVDTRLTCPPTS